jgi:hypothetical protein
MFSVEHPECHSGDSQLRTPVQNLPELIGSALIDFIRIVEAKTSSMAAIAVQDDTNVSRQRPPLKLVLESALVNPVEKSER